VRKNKRTIGLLKKRQAEKDPTQLAASLLLMLAEGVEDRGGREELHNAAIHLLSRDYERMVMGLAMEKGEMDEGKTTD
jgi:hypothetical protein